MIGEVLGEAFDLYKRHFGHFFPLAFLFYLVIGGISALLALLLGTAGVFIGALLAVVGYFWLAGALVEAVADVRDGRADLSFGETFSRVRPYVLRLLGAGILAGIGIAIGFVLLIVPGLLLLTWWSLIAPVIVLERVRAMDAFSRSRDLVRGNGWNVFGIVVVTWLLVVIFRSIVAAIFSPLPDWLAGLAGDLIGSSLTAPFAALAITLTYFRLARQAVGVVPAPVAPAP